MNNKTYAIAFVFLLFLYTSSATPVINTLTINSDTPTLNNTDSNFNLTISGNECSTGNTTWWNKTGQVNYIWDFNSNASNQYMDVVGGVSYFRRMNVGNLPYWNQTCGTRNNPCIDVYNTSSLNTTTSLSLTESDWNLCFEYRSKNTVFQDYNVIFQLQSASGAGSTNRTRIHSVGNRLRLRVDSDDVSNDGNIYLNPNAIGTSWEHECIIYDLSTGNITTYYNGTLYDSGYVGNFTMPVAELFIFSSSNTPHNMSFDNMWLGNYKLSDSEVYDRFTCDSQGINCTILRASQTTVGDIWTANAICSNASAYSNKKSQSVKILSLNISSITNTSITSNSFIINLELTSPADATVYVSTSPTMAYPTIFYSPFASTHTILIAPLYNNTKYYFQVNGTEGNYNYNSIIYSITTLQTGEEGENMAYISIIIGLIGFCFFLVYIANTLNTRNDQGQAIALNTLLKAILYAMAGFGAFITLQVVYSFSIADGMSLGIQNTLKTMYSLGIYLAVIILFVLLIGIFVNQAINIIQWLKGYFSKGEK